MEIQDLRKLLAEKETLIKRTELIYQQLTGQVALLRDLIKANESKEEVKEENK